MEKDFDFSKLYLTPENELGTIITLIKGEGENGNKQWAYLNISPFMFAEYANAIKQENVDVSEYGEILASGEGEQPSEEIKKEMLEKYGASEDFENLLAKILSDVLQ
jgi:hypothetical protein